MHHLRIECFLIILFISSRIFAQQNDDSLGGNLVPFKVISENGINMRESQDSTSRIIQKIPFQSEVMYNNFQYIDTFSISNWIEVQYNGKKGFVKSEYLKKGTPIKIIIPEIGMGDLYPSGKNMNYAFKGNHDGYHFTYFNTVNEIPDTIRYPDGSILIGLPYSKMDTKNIIFGISGFVPLADTEYTSFTVFNFERKFLYPGEKISYRTEKAFYMIYADGHPVRSIDADTNLGSPFSKIENYEFHIQRKMNGITEDQILYKKDIRSWTGDQYEDNITICWIGDIDNDDEMDLLLVTQSHYECWEVRFFMSSKRDSDRFLFKEIYTGAACD